MLLRDADTAFNRYLTAQLAAHGATFGQFQHLRNLWVEDGLTQAELSRRIGIEMASSTAILDSLESQGLIARIRNAADRRKINVFLTPAGAALETRLMACAADANKRASKGLTKAEVAQLFAIAAHVIETSGHCVTPNRREGGYAGTCRARRNESGRPRSSACSALG
jgi:DNA-binding MarR family transcriptional regulator